MITRSPARVRRHNQSHRRRAPPKKQPTPNETPTPRRQHPPTPAPDQLAAPDSDSYAPIPSPPESRENNGDSHADANADSNAGTDRTLRRLRLPAYRDFQQKTVIRGGINNRGRSAVNAVGNTARAIQKLLEDAIGSRWYYYTAAKIDLISIGTTVGDLRHPGRWQRGESCA